MTNSKVHTPIVPSARGGLPDVLSHALASLGPRLTRPAGRTRCSNRNREWQTKFSKKRFLAESEARVLTLLEAALPQHRIMAQVAMGALLNAAGADGKRARATRNRFAQKIVDFTVVTRDTTEVIALVELDDRTHRASKDAARDTMPAAVGYQTIRIPGKPQPTAEIVSAAVAAITASPTAAAKRVTR